MDTLIPQLYAEYGRYVNQFRMFPCILDGARCIDRRVLYTLYQLAKDKFVKSAKIVGNCIANYHPHGDLSVYNSLVGMVQNGMAVGQGNWGSTTGIDGAEAAAQRYTEVKSCPEILDMVFEYISFVPKESFELDPEPVFLPTRFPLCFIGKKFSIRGVGIGYNTNVPCYTIPDLVSRLKWILDGKKGKGPVIKPNSDCIDDSEDSEYLKLLTSGKGRINYSGRYKIDVKNKELSVTAIPPSKTFQGLLSNFSKELEVDNSLGWSDDSGKETCITFGIQRPRMLSLQHLEEKMKRHITGSMSYICNVCNTSGKVVTVSIDDMLINIYNIYKQVVKNVYVHYKKVVLEKIDELNFIEFIKPKLSECLKTHPNDVDKVISIISKYSKKSIDYVIGIFEKYNLIRLFKVSTDTIKYKRESEEIDTVLNNLENYIWQTKYKPLLKSKH